MKIRTSFVSNSSSSSFIVYVKDECNLQEELEKAFEIKEEKHPLKQISVDIAQLITHACGKSMTIEDYKEEYCYEDDDELPNGMQEMFDNGFRMYSGSFSNECGELEGFLCDNDIFYESDTLVIEHNGGY